MSRSSPNRARLWAPFTAALLSVLWATPDLAGAMPTAASPLLQLAVAHGQHFEGPTGTGKTMAAEVVASRSSGAAAGMSLEKS